MLHILSGILLSHKKELSSNEANESRTYYTEWSKSEREIQISYSNAYIQNIEKVVLKN